ncbi:MAG TPA: serine/threonine-protein kinase [Gemmataceae bacterium]|jgi:WD40 repeat protein
MNACPVPEQLRQLLAKAISGAEREQIENHVENCAACQEMLAKLSDSLTPEEQQTRDGGQRWSRHDPDSGFLRPFQQEAMDTTTGGEGENEPKTAPSPKEAAATSTGDWPRVPGYELLGVLGRGGMGVVYKARQVNADRLVALKMILAGTHAGPAELARFRTEAETIARLQHPHVVQVFEVGEHQGLPFFSLEFCPGGSLKDKLGGTPLTPREAVVLVAKLARAVQAAHAAQVLHRDLKPGNVLLAADDTPKVTDFGLAKKLDTQGVTISGDIMGTPSYMAPEQANGQSREVGPAADVYALGAILYECLTGRPPFKAATALDTLSQVVSKEPVLPRQLNAQVPRDLETVCLKCLHKEASKRYASAAELADDLGRFQTGEPILARPVGKLERGVKWVRRKPALAALSALLVLVFFTGFAGVSWQWRRAEGEYQRAAGLTLAEQRTAYGRAASLAYDEWRAGNAGLAEQLLAECRPELRGWEWHYLRRLFQGRQLATLDGHAGEVLAVAFSPDGSRFASAGAEGNIKVWDRQNLQEIFTLRGHAAAVTTVVFSPDGRRLASGSADGRVRVWDAARGEIVVTWRAHAAVTGLDFDPSGGRLASTGRGEQRGELKLWDATTGKALAGKPCPNLLTAVVFGADGRSLVTSGHDGNVLVWNATTLDASPRDFKGHPAQIVPWTSVALSADGQWVAIGGSGGVVRVWDKSTAQEFLTPTQAGVSGLAFGGRDGRILTATADNSIHGWFTKSGKPAFTLRGHRRAVTAVACSPDGCCLVSGSRDRTVKLWDISRRDDDRILRFPNEGFTSLAFHPDGKWLASAARDKALKVSNLATGTAVVTVRRLPTVMNGLAFRPGGREETTPTLLASAGGDGAIRIWEVPTEQEKLCLRGHGGPVHAVAFRPDGDCLASAGDDGTIRVWGAMSGRERLCLRGHAGPIRAVAFTPDGRRLASAGDDGTVRLWAEAAGQELLVLGDHNGPVYAVVFSLDGRYLATGGRDEAVRIWDAATGNLVHTLQGHAGALRALAYGPGGRLASAGDDSTVRMWDSAGHELLALRGHTDAVRALVFSPDGNKLASASEDRTIKIWDGTPLDEAPDSDE